MYITCHVLCYSLSTAHCRVTSWEGCLIETEVSKCTFGYPYGLLLGYTRTDLVSITFSSQNLVYDVAESTSLAGSVQFSVYTF